MKKILALLILISAITSCGKSSEPEEPIGEYGYERYNLEELRKKLDEFGCNPSDWESINRIYGCIDSTNYKLAWGQKDTCAWVAKFKPDGTEIWSYENNIKGSFNASNSSGNLLSIKDNKIFIITTAEYNQYSFDRTKIYLSIIDLLSGKEISCSNIIIDSYHSVYFLEKISNYYIVDYYNRFIINKEGKIIYQTTNYIKAYPCFDNILLSTRTGNDYTSLTLINSKGEVIWKRESLSDQEKEYGFDYYNQKMRTFLDNERLFYGYYSDFKIINIKEYTLLHAISHEQVPMKGDKYGKKNISYQWDTCYIENNNIRIVYCEDETNITSTDPISGSSTYETKTIKYYYDIDKDTYQILGNGKFE